MEDFNEVVRYYGHVILDSVIEWCLDNPETFAGYGTWGSVVAIGVFILGITIYLYEDYYQQNQDTP